ncbi:MAG: cadherin-like beta sandwich domain-containing protein [Oscillospiraceae bacterium]|nr:cadherin-like beta sandwich domain-containing protein [Clostridia bacterium]MBO5638978.1 cadherin-like beta sandwich domain-containing protein [Oscillospiraceae bacterium]
MKKLISMVLITMILCSLLSVPALAEDAQGQAAGGAETATMSVTGGTINPDGTVSWAVGENILTITMPDGSTYTITVIYDPEAAAPAALTALTVSGTEIPMTDNAAAAATPNATDTVAIVTDPADATVTINGEAVENGEAAFTWAEGSNELAIEVSKEGFETTAYTLTVEYTPVKEEAAPEETNAPEETAAPEEVVAPEEPAAPEVVADPEPAEVSALAALTVDGKEIDLDKFVKGASDEKQSSYSFNAAADAEYFLTTATGTVAVTAAEGWTVSSVKLNGVSQTAAAADTYSLKWAKANDLEITLKENGSEFKAVYSLILTNTLDEAAADTLTVNGADVSYLTSIQAAQDNSYSLQVAAGEGKSVAVTVNGLPVALDASGMLVVPAVTGVADSVVVTVSKEGCLDKSYSFTVNAVQVAPAQTAGEPTADVAEDAADDMVDAEAGVEETVDNTTSPEIPV